MRRLLLVTALLSACAVCLAQSKVRSPLVWDVEKVSARIAGDSLEVVMDYLLLDDRVAGGAIVTLSPSLKWIDRSYPLVPLLVRSRDAEVRHGSFKVLTSGGGGRRVSVVSRIPYDEGMDSFSISVMLTEERGSKEYRGERRQVAVFSRTERPEFSPSLYMVEPPAFISRERVAEIPLRLVYEGDGTTVDPALGDNEPALGEFMGRCSAVALDARTKVNGIDLFGYMWIGGPEQENRRIASARTRNLNMILAEGRIFGSRRASVKYTGEDWEGVARWLGSSFWSGDPELEQLVSGPEGRDARERRLKTDFPEVWESMERTLMPEAGRFVCRISYTVDEFTTEAELMDAYRTDSRFLDPNDYYRLLTAFEPRSYGWLELLLTCASAWPESVHARVNAASALMMMGRYREAGAYLHDCEQTDDILYMRALQLAGIGNIEGCRNILGTIRSDRSEIIRARESLEEIRRWDENASPWIVRLYSIGQPW